MTLTIDEAIKILETFYDQAACTLDAISANAFKLGIEALKVYKMSQASGWYPPGYRLPGETEE